MAELWTITLASPAAAQETEPEFSDSDLAKCYPPWLLDF